MDAYLVRLIQAAPDPVIAVDDEGIVLDANPAAAKLFRYDVRTLVGLSVDRLMPMALPPKGPHGSDRWPRGDDVALRAAVRTRQGRRGDGTVVAVELSLWPVRSSAGGSLSLGVVRDVSDQVQRDASLRRARVARGAREKEAAHDLNNLLLVLGLQIDLLRTAQHEGERERLADEATAAINAASSLLRQLERSEAAAGCGRIDLDHVLVELSPLLRAVVGRGVRVCHRRRSAAAGIRADAGVVEQIMLNLAANARDAMPDGGTLSIEVDSVRGAHVCPERGSCTPDKPNGELVRLVVADTGSGMSAEVLGRVFEPGFTTKGPDRGKGMGLAMVKRAVQQLGGRVHVTSSLGSGSRFEIYLPSAALPDDPPPTE